MKCPALPERLSPTRHDPAGAAVLVAPATCGPDRAPGRAPRGSAARNTGPGGPSRESPVRTRRPAGEWGWGQAGRASAAHAHSARESTSSGFTFQKMSSLRDKGHVRSAPTALGGGAGRGHRASLKVWALTPSQPRRHCARVFASPFFHLTNEDNNVTRLQETV